MDSKLNSETSAKTDPLYDVPTPSAVRERITQNRREAAVLRQLLKAATRKSELLGDASPSEVAPCV